MINDDDSREAKYSPDLPAIKLEALEQYKQWVYEAIDPEDIGASFHNIDVYMQAAINFIDWYVRFHEKFQEEIVRHDGELNDLKLN